MPEMDDIARENEELKKRLGELEYVAREAVNCDAMTGLLAYPPDVIRHLKSHIEDLAEVLDAKAS